MDWFPQSDESIEADCDFRVFSMDYNTYAADMALDSLEDIAMTNGDTQLAAEVYVSRINLTLNS